MSWVDYARQVLGNKRVNELIKEYNLCTKKWTWGRFKPFLSKLKKECKTKERQELEKLFKEVTNEK